MKHLRQVTKEILQEVESVSGKSIEFMRDEELPVLASLTMARNGAEFHLLRYKPSNEPMDYFVAHQAGYILRLFQCEPNFRFDLSATGVGEETMASLLNSGVQSESFENSNFKAASQMLTQWCLMNLRSLPIGMRIDEWISTNHAELKDLQATGIALQHQQNINLLSHKISGHYIPSILMGHISAYAMFADRLLNVEQFATPFAASGLKQAGFDLMEIWDQTTHTASSDCELVDAWATYSSIRNWYEWTTYTS